MNKIESNADWLRSKIISPEEFVSLFEDRFFERCISMTYRNSFVNIGMSFEEVVVVWYADNTVHFYEASGETTYSFEINLDNIKRIEMIDYWANHACPEIDLGAQFAFVGKDNSHIIINADK